MSSSKTFASLSDFERAQQTLRGVVTHTPVQTSRHLGAYLGGAKVVMKCENLQRTGAYKLRGAYNRMVSLSEAERANGVVAASAGNHAQGVALAAKELGISATIFMPRGVALPKLEATRTYGAEVVLEGVVVEQSLAAARTFAEETGATYIPPFDHEDVIVGQGTVALELLADAPEIDTLVVPIGGGGLIAGMAAVAKQQAAQAGRTIRVIGVQAENAAPFVPSLVEGVPVTIQAKPTIADGIAVSVPGRVTFDYVREFVDEVVTVTDDDIARAILLLLERAKLLVEPAGAVGAAAIMAHKITSITDANIVGTVLSGGNIDPLLLQRVISHGLAADERYLKIRVMLPDLPGQLARTAELVADADANVVEVLHTRHGGGLQINEVELELHIETRGHEHREDVVRKLQDAGLQVRLDLS